MIIHSPIFSGSINQAESAYANLSGSFTGSFTGVGNFVGLEADSVAYENVTGKPALVSGSSQVSYPNLSNIPSGIISSSAQIDTLFNIEGLISGGGEQDYIPLFKSNTELSSSYLHQSLDTLKTFAHGINKGINLSFLNDEYLLGNSTTLTGSYVSVNSDAGITTIKSNNYTNVQDKLVVGDINVGDEALLVSGSIKATSGITATSFNGNINANNGVVSGSTQVQFNDITNNPFSHSGSNVTILAGKKIRSSDENTIVIAENLDVEGNITLLGAVDGVDISAFKTDFDAFKVQTFVTGSSQVVGILSSLNTYTSSNDTKWNNLGSQSGSFARTNSANTFNGNQVVSGSLTVTQDFIVLGSSSIQNISSSTLDIGTNLITVNVNQPAVRFGGLAVIDSGSGGQSGSFLYDAVEDEFIFVHRGDGTNITSSHFVLGPETYNNLGNELYLTNNRVPKGTGKEHLNDSNITDNGTTITLGSNTVVTGTIVASGTALVSGSSQITYSGISSIPVGIVSGSSQVTPLLPTGVVSGSSQVVGILGSLNSYTASNDTANTTQNSRLDQLSTASGSAITRLNLLEIETANLETFSGSALNRLGVLEVETANLEAFTGSINTTIKTQLNVNTVVSGSSQVAIASTSGFGTWINQAVLTSSDVQFAKLGVGGASDATYELRVVGDIGATGDIVAYVSSDERLKNNVELISNPIEKVQALRGVTWEWNELASDAAKQSPNVGVIAQEVEKVLPQLVHDRENGFKGVDYAKLTGLLIEAIKEQQKQIDELKSRL